jgi:hypothetical protein
MPGRSHNRVVPDHLREPTGLVPAQRAALAYVTATATARRSDAVRRLGDTVTEWVDAVRQHARVTLNFHPDRLLPDGTTVAEGLARDGVYRGQFETAISNGSRTAFPGGDRDRWERLLFGGAYHTGGGQPAHRPRYGSLNLANHPDGGAPRFGSCHLRLRPKVNERCTFTVGDSHLGPTDVGTLEAFECVLAGLVSLYLQTGTFLGLAGMDPRTLVLPRVTTEPGRALDDYVEAQVHGGVDLRTDVEAVVLDPSFRGTDAGELLVATAARHDLDVGWHAGFELAPEEFTDEFVAPMCRRWPALSRLSLAATASTPRSSARLRARSGRTILSGHGSGRMRSWCSTPSTCGTR